MNIICIKSSVIKRAVGFIRGLSHTITNTVFTSSFPQFSITSFTGYRNLPVLHTCHVQIIFVSVNVYFLNLASVFEIISFSQPNLLGTA